MVAEEFEAGLGGEREREGGGDVGAGVEGGGEAEEDVGAVGCDRVGFEGGDGGLGVESVEPEPAAELEIQRVDDGGRCGGVEVGGHRLRVLTTDHTDNTDSNLRWAIFFVASWGGQRTIRFHSSLADLKLTSKASRRLVMAR